MNSSSVVDLNDDRAASVSEIRLEVGKTYEIDFCVAVDGYLTIKVSILASRIAH